MRYSHVEFHTLNFSTHNYSRWLKSQPIQLKWTVCIRWQLKIQYQMICFSSDHTLAPYQVDVLLASVLQLRWRRDFPPERSCAGRRPGSRYSSWWCGTRSGNLRHTLCHITNSRRSRFGRIGTPPNSTKNILFNYLVIPAATFKILVQCSLDNTIASVTGIEGVWRRCGRYSQIAFLV